MSKKPVFVWMDNRGINHYIPFGSCVICNHCTDIFLDPWRNNEIYSCVCEYNQEPVNCNNFELQEDMQYKKIGEIEI